MDFGRKIKFFFFCSNTEVAQQLVKIDGVIKLIKKSKKLSKISESRPAVMPKTGWIFGHIFGRKTGELKSKFLQGNGR